jgi:hypothetical protein
LIPIKKADPLVSKRSILQRTMASQHFHFSSTVASIRNSEFETTCSKCANALIAPEWSEFVSEGLVGNLWTCTNCGNRFETEVCMPADAAAEAEAIKDVFSSLLVA